MNERHDSTSEITEVEGFFCWQLNKPLIHEKSWSSWGLRRQRGGWWGALGSQDWVSTRLQPPLEPLRSGMKQSFSVDVHSIHVYIVNSQRKGVDKRWHFAE